MQSPTHATDAADANASEALAVLRSLYPPTLRAWLAPSNAGAATHAEDKVEDEEEEDEEESAAAAVAVGRKWAALVLLQVRAKHSCNRTVDSPSLCLSLFVPL
jgi:hypothetical protein